jgi:hypothetical protein
VTEQLQIRQCKLDSGSTVSFDGSVLTVDSGDPRESHEVFVSATDVLALQWVLTGRKARGAASRPAVKAKASEPKGGAS